ncbi:MAG: MBL fold metallo-hydrolase [Holophagales bacterium]|nr:MBL fold metallo-hydrolase [Holophagales bacterium]MYF95452.1 MBL fold metallo-hydrolase [Holophagales bacterium]
MDTLLKGTPVRLSDRVVRVTQDNPGMFTGPGTNTYVIGGDGGPAFVLDPGEEDDAHFEAVLSAVGDRKVAAMLISHTHRDHWPLAPRIAEHTGAEIRAFSEQPPFTAGPRLEDDFRLSAGGTTLVALHTPGHASDHLCFLLEEERAVFTADLVMGWSTSIIAPPDGNLNQYMASLERLLEFGRGDGIDILYPGHGESIKPPLDRVREIHRHRQQRTDQALEAIAAGVATIPEMVERIYTDVDPKLHGPAAFSLRAHLDALVEEGKVKESSPGRYEPVVTEGQDVANLISRARANSGLGSDEAMDLAVEETRRQRARKE